MDIGRGPSVEHRTTQYHNDYPRQQQVHRREQRKWKDKTRHRCDRIRRPHHAMDDPGLPAKLGHHPSGLEGDESQRHRIEHRAQKPARLEDPAPPRQPGRPHG
jgi:hypothetical protein